MWGNWSKGWVNHSFGRGLAVFFIACCTASSTFAQRPDNPLGVDDARRCMCDVTAPIPHRRARSCLGKRRQSLFCIRIDKSHAHLTPTDPSLRTTASLDPSDTEPDELLAGPQADSGGAGQFPIFFINSSLQSSNSFKRLNAIQFADQFPARDNSAKIQAAIDACDSSCVVDARALPSESSGGSTTIDPGTSKVITLFLPAGKTFIRQIRLRSSLHIYGQGSGGGSQQTILQSCPSCSDTDVFVIGGTAPVTGVVVEGLRIYGSNGSDGATKQSAVSLVAAAGGGGVWWSRFQDLSILGFAGGGAVHGVIRLDGAAGGSPPGENQFDTFMDIELYRTTGGGPALEIHGMTGQIDFVHDHFDGQPSDLTGTNVLIDDVSSSLFPFNLNFHDFTVQAGGVGFDIAGCNECTFRQIHMEKTPRGFLVRASPGANSMIQIEDSQFNNNVGIDSGTGYLVDVEAPARNASVLFTGNNFGSPDQVFSGNREAVAAYGNTGGNLVKGSEWNVYSAFPSLTIRDGVANDSGGFKHKRGTSGCATPNSIGAACDTRILWTTPFRDTHYTVNCVGDGVTSGVPVSGGIIAKTDGEVVFRTTAASSAAAQYTTIDCIAVHDAAAEP